MTTATEDPAVAEGHSFRFDRLGREHRERTSAASSFYLLLMPVTMVVTILLIAWLTTLQG